jgi:hypothetical protein
MAILFELGQNVLDEVKVRFAILFVLGIARHANSSDGGLFADRGAQL